MPTGGRAAACALLIALGGTPAAGQTRDTSYATAAGERVLRFETTVAAPVEDVWRAVTTAGGMATWLAPDVTIELRTGGAVVPASGGGRIGNSGAASLDIVNYLDKELVTFRIHLDDRFSETIREEDDHLQEIVRLVPLAQDRTLVVSSTVGWGNSRIWDDAYAFFRKRTHDSQAKLAAALAARRQ